MKLLAPLGLALSLIASAAFAAQPVSIVDPANGNSAVVTSGNVHVHCDSSCTGGGGGGVVTGNQSNAGAGTTGSANVGTNAYGYVWNGSSWVQETQPGASANVGATGSAVPSSANLIGGGAAGGTGNLTGATMKAASTAAVATDTSLVVQEIAGSPLITAINSPIPAGTNLIGKVGIDQTTPGTTNGVQVNAALPAGTNLVGKAGIDQTTPGTTNNVTISTNVGTLPLVQATASAAVSTSSAATLQVVAASGSTVIRVTHWELVTTLANNVTWESADTGGSCANPVALTGAMPFAANGGASAGSGLGPILILPSGKALCMLTSAATQISGSVAYAQF